MASSDSSTGSRFVSPVDLRAFIVSSCERAGLDGAAARQAADVLMWASLRGVDTHGIRNLVPYYLNKFATQEVCARPNMRQTSSTKSVLRFDGDGGSGLITAATAMRAAIERAEKTGVGIATVENTHHLGPAGYFASLALEHDMLGICSTGHFFAAGYPTGVAPIGGAMAMFSTNPISFAAPAGECADFVLDMSTATATVNRIEMYAQAGLPLPPGWAKDANSEATVDANAAQILNPLGGEASTGGHKGAALSMMVAILTGVLTGAWKEVETDVAAGHDQPTMGHFLAAVRIDQFMPINAFKTALDAMLTSISNCPTTSGHAEPVEYPGSREARILERRLKHGVPVDDRLLAELQEAAQRLAVEMPSC